MRSPARIPADPLSRRRHRVRSGNPHNRQIKIVLSSQNRSNIYRLSFGFGLVSSSIALQRRPCMSPPYLKCRHVHGLRQRVFVQKLPQKHENNFVQVFGCEQTDLKSYVWNDLFFSISRTTQR